MKLSTYGKKKTLFSSQFWRLKDQDHVAPLVWSLVTIDGITAGVFRRGRDHSTVRQEAKESHKGVSNAFPPGPPFKGSRLINVATLRNTGRTHSNHI
jgi:hypothetical protein